MLDISEFNNYEELLEYKKNIEEQLDAIKKYCINDAKREIDLQYPNERNIIQAYYIEESTKRLCEMSRKLFELENELLEVEKLLFILYNNQSILESKTNEELLEKGFERKLTKDKEKK